MVDVTWAFVSASINLTRCMLPGYGSRTTSPSNHVIFFLGPFFA